MADDKKKDKGAKPAKSKPAEAKAAKPAKAAKAAKSDDAGAKAARSTERPHAPTQKPRLAKFYDEKVRAQLMEKFGYTSPMQAPRFQKIVVNMGVGDALTDVKLLDAAVNELGQIAGQRPSIRRSKKSIANFKLREGQPIGCMVTLRGARMYEFYDRLINVAVPRIRDFRGVNPRSFDGQGNYSFGVKEQIIFPEIAYDQIDQIRGMDITITTSAGDDKKGRALLEAFNFPFRK